jgi:hypothetical protein
MGETLLPRNVGRKYTGGYVSVVLVSLLAAFFAVIPVWAKGRCPQTAETLPVVKIVYVESLGDNQGAKELRDWLIQRLRKARGIQLTQSPNGADAVITGTGSVWITGFIRTSPKPSPWSRQAVFDGYLSVELKGKDNQTLANCSVKPARFHWNEVPRDLADRCAKKLLAGLQHNS